MHAGENNITALYILQNPNSLKDYRCIHPIYFICIGSAISIPLYGILVIVTLSNSPRNREVQEFSSHERWKMKISDFQFKFFGDSSNKEKKSFYWHEFVWTILFRLYVMFYYFIDTYGNPLIPFMNNFKLPHFIMKFLRLHV